MNLLPTLQTNRLLRAMKSSKISPLWFSVSLIHSCEWAFESDPTRMGLFSFLECATHLSILFITSGIVMSWYEEQIINSSSTAVAKKIHTRIT